MLLVAGSDQAGEAMLGAPLKTAEHRLVNHHVGNTEYLTGIW